MRKYLLAAVAAAAITSPAAARDGQGYVGIEGGILFPRDLNGNALVGLTTTPGTPAGPASFNFGDAFDAELKRGFDVDAIAGFDFGGFRVEGELGYKWADREGFDPDAAFLTQLNAALNRPSAAPDPGAPGSPALTEADFEDLDGKITMKSAMVNALADFGADDGVSFFAGAGVGRAWGRALNDGDSAWAWQLLAGVRSAVSSNIDIGLKYRYFQTGGMNFRGGPIGFGGNINRTPTGATTFVDQRTVAQINPELDGKFRSHSLLASLIFNFGAPAVEVLPPPPPPPPPPATQTCPDGSVILATDVCPAPPPPPPPPPPAGERG